MATDEQPPAAEGSAAVRLAGGTFWVTVSKVAGFVIETARNIVLARLVLPAEHGLFGVAVVAAALVAAFSYFGFDLALIRRRGSIRGDLDTAWTVSTAIGVGAAAVLVLIAPLVAALVRLPEAVAVVRAYALVLLALAPYNLAVVELHRRFEFKRLFLIDIVGPLVQTAAGIVAAVLWRDVWALWAGALAGAAASTAASFVFLPWRPVPAFDRGSARALFRFGRWIAAGRILHFLFHQATDLVVARMLGSAALGHYRRAHNWAGLPTFQITGVTATVTRPLFGRLQDRPAELHEALRQALAWVALLGFPALAAIVGLAPVLVGPVLGAPWTPMIPALQVLAFQGATRLLHATLGPCLDALNRPDVLVRTSLVKVVLLAVLIYPLTLSWGIVGTAAAVAVAAVLELPLLLATVAQLLGVPGGFKSLVRQPLAFAACAALMAAAMFWTERAVAAAGVLGAAAAVAGSGIAVFAVAALAADRLLGLGVRDTLSMVLRLAAARRR